MPPQWPTQISKGQSLQPLGTLPQPVATGPSRNLHTSHAQASASGMSHMPEPQEGPQQLGHVEVQASKGASLQIQGADSAQRSPATWPQALQALPPPRSPLRQKVTGESDMPPAHSLQPSMSATTINGSGGGSCRRRQATSSEMAPTSQQTPQAPGVHALPRPQTPERTVLGQDATPGGPLLQASSGSWNRHHGPTPVPVEVEQADAQQQTQQQQQQQQQQRPQKRRWMKGGALPPAPN